MHVEVARLRMDYAMLLDLLEVDHELYILVGELL